MEYRAIRIAEINDTWNIVGFINEENEIAINKGTLTLSEMIPPPEIEPEAWDYYPCLSLCDGDVLKADKVYKKMPFDEVVWKLYLKNTREYNGGTQSEDKH